MSIVWTHVIRILSWAALLVSVPTLALASTGLTCSQLFSTALHEIQIPHITTLPRGFGQRVDSTLGQHISGANGAPVIRAANERYERCWSCEFIHSRYIAADYDARSLYYQVSNESLEQEYHAPRSLQHSPEATIAVTWSKFTRDEIETANISSILAQNRTIPLTSLQRQFLLPEEETLRRPVQRFYDSSGRGLVIELRTNSKMRGASPNLAFQIRAQEVSWIMSLIRDYPELYDQPIIKAYADPSHLRLYGPRSLNFVIEEFATPIDQPVILPPEYDSHQTPWWAIRLSPRELEQSLFQMEIGAHHIINGINQPFPLRLRDGLNPVYARAHSVVEIDEDGHPTSATLDREGEVAAGLFAGEGAKVSWRYGQLTFVSKTSRPAQLKILDDNVFIGAGAQVAIGVHELTEPSTWKISDCPQSIALTRWGVVASPGADITAFRSNQTTGIDVTRTTDDVHFHDGVVAAKGSFVSLRSIDNVISWSRLTLATAAVIDGVSYESGSELIRRPKGHVGPVHTAIPVR